MQIDFDKLRLQMATQYNVLAKKVYEMEESPERQDLALSVDDLHDSVASILSLESTGGDVFKSVDAKLVALEYDDTEDEDS